MAMESGQMSTIEAIVFIIWIIVIGIAGAVAREFVAHRKSRMTKTAFQAQLDLAKRWLDVCVCDYSMVVSERVSPVDMS